MIAVQTTFVCYTDGSSIPLGDAASAFLLRDEAGALVLKRVAFIGPSTPAEAELFAIFLAIHWFTNHIASQRSFSTLKILSDSAYVVEGMNGGYERWRQQKWRLNNGAPRESAALWELIAQLCESCHCECERISGHSGIRENEACHRASLWIARKGPSLLKLHGESAIGRVAKTHPERAWHLLDAEGQMQQLRMQDVADAKDLNEPAKSVPS